MLYVKQESCEYQLFKSFVFLPDSMREMNPGLLTTRRRSNH